MTTLILYEPFVLKSNYVRADINLNIE